MESEEPPQISGLSKKKINTANADFEDHHQSAKKESEENVDMASEHEKECNDDNETILERQETQEDEIMSDQD